MANYIISGENTGLTAGDTWEMTWTFPIELVLTGVSACLQFRPQSKLATIALECSTANHKLSVSGQQVIMTVPKESTRISQGIYEIQLELTWPDGYRQSLPIQQIPVKPDRTVK